MFCAIFDDYVSFEVAKLLKEKGFDENTPVNYFVGDDKPRGCVVGEMVYHRRKEEDTHLIACPTLQMAMKWLREEHNILLVVDYDYECTDTSYCYKIYRLEEHGKPKKVAVKSVSYDKDGKEYEHTDLWCDYERSHKDYGKYEEAGDAAIKYTLKNLI